MKHRLVNKLRSQRGASLFLALLLFAVCAVVGIVVLVAGTTAAGRAAGVAKMERRYYNVMSAAEAVKESFSAKKTRFTVEVDENGDITSVECDDDDGLLAQWSGYVLKSTGDKSDADFSSALVSAMSSWQSTPTDSMKDAYFTVTVDGVPDLDARVQIEPSEEENDNQIIFKIYNANLDNGKEDARFVLKLRGNADILKEEVPYLDGTKTIYYTVTWTFSDVAR